MTREERNALLRERLTALQAMERALHTAGYSYVAGVDEVGRGPLAGPVVAAAVVLPPDFDVLGVDDSKKLSEKRREALYTEILDRAVCYGIGRREPADIDRLNILEATRLAMADAVAAADRMLAERWPGAAIDYVLFDAMTLPAVQKPQQSLIRGDSRSLAIAAASIVAKVTRDREMIRMDAVYPGYEFAKNKGYGTRSHYAGLAALGMTPIHRRSFLKKLEEHR